ncbi:MAG: hypothetical protein ACPG4U_06400 [Pseudomonadales bacterium]
MPRFATSLAATAVALLTLIAQPVAAGSVRIYNHDSTLHMLELKCAGSSKTIAVKSSSTSTYTFHSTKDSCKIIGGSVDFPTSELKDGQSWKIASSKAQKN